MLHPKKKICPCVRLILVLVGGRQTAIVVRIMYKIRMYHTFLYQVRIMYQIRMHHTCRCTINGTAVSLFVYSLVGGGTHDTYVPPKKQLYRYLFIR